VSVPLAVTFTFCFNLFAVCNQQSDKKLFHLRSLIEGALYRELGDTEMAIQVRMFSVPFFAQIYKKSSGL